MNFIKNVLNNKMRISISFCITIIAFIYTSEISAQSFQWAKSIKSEGYDEGYDLTSDADGNTYVAGMLEFDTDFGNGVILSSAGIHDIFLAKYSSTGRLVWAKRAGGKGGDKIQSIVLDGRGNLYAVGEYEDTAYFESIMKVTSGAGINNMFIAKYDTTGSVLWVKNLASTGTIHTRGYGVTCDAAGNVYACGGTKGDTYFEGNYLFTSAGDYDGTVVKFDPTGNFQWAKRMGGSDSDKAYGIASDDVGNVYVTGYFVGTADFSPSVSLNGGGHTDIFLAKYNTNGNLQWAKMAGDTGFDRGWDVMVNVNGQIIITGEFQTGYFGSTHLFSRGNQDMFLAAYNSSGDNLWAVDGGGIEDDIGRGLGHDDAGNILVIGDYAETGNFPPQIITSNGFADIFAASYSPDGTTLNWIKTAGGHDSDRGRGIASDAAGNTYICGEFVDSIQMGNTNLIGNLYLDIYVSKIIPGPLCSTQLSVNSQNSCAGQCNGIAFAIPLGQNPFNYSWSTTPAQLTDTARGLCAGTYFVTMTDGAGCTASASVTLTDPLPLQLATSGIDATCNGACTGTSTVVASGESPFTYDWSTTPFQTTENATALCAGNYSVIVTDKFGCTQTDNVTINEPSAIQMSAVITNSTCIGCADGRIDVTVNGGTPGYQYLWSIGEITQDLSILLAGTYELCVTDNNGCHVCDTYIVLDSGTGIDDLGSSGISIYPNPFSTNATIKLNAKGNEITKLKLHSAIGQLVFETEFSGNEYLLHSTNFSKGVYFIQLTNSEHENKNLISVIIE